ncbi:MAG TPA: hypothetical protein PLN06_08490 [Bacteroidales bacterium]|nr:hypothetical protein [Bacteroidales bacterium]HOU96645.1 hypothetical protein [Bacteroidales bacterium]HQG36742.1 hypothetical protein [Bacteroidales bacterium]HQG53248.1 hypothetical protein [Bacteroidales bacterium]
MKKINIIYTMAIAIILIIVIYSCQKEDNSIVNERKLELDTIYNELFTLGEQVCELNSSIDFKNLVYQEVEKKFDGDYNVLISIIESKYLNSDEPGNKGLNLKSSCNILKEWKKYPQIYIPFYEELKSEGKLNVKAPVFVFYTDENENGLYEGYVLSKKGRLSKLDYLISEEYARNNEVWVFSINERVDENGEVAYSFEDPCTMMLYYKERITEKNTLENGTFKSALDCTPPGTPCNTEALPLFPYSIRVKWQDIQGVSYYKVYRETNYSAVYNEIATIYPSQGATYLDQNRTVGVHYDYQIQAYNTSDCYSARSFGTGTWASWRTNNYNEILNQIYISDGCWNWCCSWPEGKIELMYRIVKYNKSDQQVEYPKNSLPQKSKSSQKGKWCTYDKELFCWDITKYAYNYLLFFYEDDGGNDKGTTIKLSASLKPTDKINVGAEISFTIDDKDEELGWIEIYHFDSYGKEYSLSPRKGSASIKLRQ